MFIVTLGEEAGHTDYGPFTSHPSAARFASFLSNEVDPARVFEVFGDPGPLHSPVDALLAWYERFGAKP